MADEKDTEKPTRTKRALKAVTPERTLLGGIVTAVLAVGGVFDKKFDELRAEAREAKAEQTARIDKLETRLGSKLDKANTAIAGLTVKAEVADKTRALEVAAAERRFATNEEAINELKRATK